MKKNLILFSCLFLISCNKESVVSKDYFCKIETDYFIDYFFIDVKINGKPHKFLVDSGAEKSVLSEELFKDLNLKEKSQITIFDSQGNSTANVLTNVKSIEIGQVCFESIDFVVSNINFLEFKCKGISGIIGNNILSKTITLFDFENKRVILTDNKSKLGLKHYQHKITMNQNRPLPTINLNNSEFIFDTGNNGYNSTNQSFSIYDEIIGLSPIASINSKHHNPHYKTKIFKESYILGNQTLERQLFYQAEKNLTGNLFLKQFQLVVLEYNKTIYFKNINNIKGSIKDDFLLLFGFNYQFDFGNNLILSATINRKLTSLQYLRLGDTIEKIGNIDFRYVTRENICQKLTSDIHKEFFNNDSIFVQVKRNQKRMTFYIKSNLKMSE
jgi:hypothetical protein